MPLMSMSHGLELPAEELSDSTVMMSSYLQTAGASTIWDDVHLSLAGCGKSLMDRQRLQDTGMFSRKAAKPQREPTDFQP